MVVYKNSRLPQRINPYEEEDDTEKDTEKETNDTQSQRDKFDNDLDELE